MRLIFLGMRGPYSRTVLDALLRTGFQPRALIIPSAPPLPGESRVALRRVESTALPLLPTDTVTLAHVASVPVWEVGRLRAAETLAALRALASDVIVTACFPRRLPPQWLAAPRLGCLNLHPSLLPAYRGPEPLFWQFRNGERQTGVTLHVMDETADTGALVAQAAVPFPDGLRYDQAEWLTARAGAELLVNALRRGEWTHTPQPATGASDAPFPTPRDLVIPTEWPARRAYNFVRGAAPFGPFTVSGEAGPFRVRQALAWAAAPVASESGWVRFADGWVLFAA
jgi:methionyl-tRNA formyltransferase